MEKVQLIWRKIHSSTDYLYSATFRAGGGKELFPGDFAEGHPFFTERTEASSSSQSSVGLSSCPCKEDDGQPQWVYEDNLLNCNWDVVRAFSYSDNSKKPASYLRIILYSYYRKELAFNDIYTLKQFCQWAWDFSGEWWIWSKIRTVVRSTLPWEFTKTTELYALKGDFYGMWILSQ